MCEKKTEIKGHINIQFPFIFKINSSREFKEYEIQIKSKRRKTHDMKSSDMSLKKQTEYKIYGYIIKIMTSFSLENQNFRNLIKKCSSDKSKNTKFIEAKSIIKENFKNIK